MACMGIIKHRVELKLKNVTTISSSQVVADYFAYNNDRKLDFDIKIIVEYIYYFISHIL